MNDETDNLVKNLINNCNKNSENKISILATSTLNENNIYLLDSDNVYWLNAKNNKKFYKTSSLNCESDFTKENEISNEDQKLNLNIESLDLNLKSKSNKTVIFNRSFQNFVQPKNFSNTLISSSSNNSSSSSSSSLNFYSKQNKKNESELNICTSTIIDPNQPNLKSYLNNERSSVSNKKSSCISAYPTVQFKSNNLTHNDKIDSIILDEFFNENNNNVINKNKIGSYNNCINHNEKLLLNKNYKKLYQNFISQTELKIDKPASMKLLKKDSSIQLEESHLNILDKQNFNNLEFKNEDSISSSSFVLPIKESLPLKRTHAIPDLHSIDDFSPVTFDTSISLKSEDVEENSKVDLIEETKEIISGIKIRAAKLPKLIQILIESFDEFGDLVPSTDFPRVFFLMHKWFMESEELVKMLSDLYLKYEDNHEQHSIIYQLKICHTFRYWINNFTFHFVLDNILIDSIKKFSNIVVSNGHKDHLKFFDITKLESYDWMRKLTTKNTLKPKQKIPLGFDKIEPEVLANQLTFLEWKTLRRISFSDYKSYAIKGNIHDNPPLERSIQLFNGLSQWIQCMVLSKTTPRQRADIIHKFIDVAKHLRQLQNFNSLMAVIGGICHSALARLSKTNLYLSVEDQKVLSDFMELLSSNCNYGQYRKTISEIQHFWIPIIGIHLKDMISLHTAHLDKLDNDLINFRKMAKLSVIFQSVTNLQNSIPPVQENRDFIKLLQLSLDMSYSEDEIYELSLAREPRTSVSSPSTPSRISAFADWAKSISTPPDPQTIQKHVNAMVDAVFKNYDHDRDGFISQAEFYEIAQNFPFIDTFAVLDADKDGMISGVEMKTYFLKANYHALKTEFKHEFHETTYFKPTFCNHCDGFLWGLIKQGWKCKDCGINAHRGCKDRIVIECRPKRNYALNRQQSSSLSETIRNRSISTRSSAREHPKVKQKATQTDNYEDLFISDESISSNEETFSKNSGSTLFTSSTLIENDNNDLNFEDSQIINNRSNRNTLKKKSPKRRKSLPSQCSFIAEPHQSVTLIPRGPLICSNSENLENWLPERVVSNPQQNITSSSIVCNKILPDLSKIVDQSSTSSSILLTPKLTVTNTPNSSLLLKSKNNEVNSIVNTTKPFTKISTYASIIDYNKKFEKKNSESFLSTNKTFKNNQNNTTSSLIISKPIIKLIPRPIETIPFKPSRLELNCEKNLSPQRARAESSNHDVIINGYNSDNISSSNDEDNDVFFKLKEAEKEKEKLAIENAKIKMELESANAELFNLKEKFSIIKKNNFKETSNKESET